MNTFLNRFRSVFLDNPKIDPRDDRLLIERHGRLACHYAPFEHINPRAKVVLLGITPGTQQAGNALMALHAALKDGTDDAHALKRAKQTASFSGPMRNNLIGMLDRIGLQKVLEIDTCARLFDTRTELVHFTSALRYPVFVDGKDYSGSPSILTTPALRGMTMRWLQDEIHQLRNAYWIPLGKETAAVLADCVARGELMANRVLSGMPHPSGANAERIAYFLGNKASNELSVKTNPLLLDAALKRLTAAVTGSHPETNPTTATTKAPMVEPNQSTPMPIRSVQSDMGKHEPIQRARLPRGPEQKAIDTDSRIATTFRLIGYANEPIYPMRIKDRETGRLTFVLSLRGAEMHKREHAIEVTDETEAYEKVRSGTYKIRATLDPKVAPSLLGLGNRIVKDIIRI